MQCGQSYRNEPWSPRITAQLGLESTFPAYDVVSPNDEPKNGSRPPIPTQSDEMAIKQAIALPPLCGTEPYAVGTYERQSYVSSAIAELHISKLYYDRCRGWWRAIILERFTFASPTCNSQPRIYGSQIIGVFPRRVAATVHSLEASAPGCPQATPAPPRSEPPSGRQDGSGHGSRLSPRRGWKRLLLTCLRVLGLTPPG